MRLGQHIYGRFDRRLPIGPVVWPHHDLLWIHDGRVDLRFPTLDLALALQGPDGVLILPHTPFHGAARGGAATSSVCHFTLPQDGATCGVLRARAGERSHLQAMVRLALDLARRDPEATDRRCRLIAALMDGFATADATGDVDASPGRLEAAWTAAARNPGAIRSLADVAATVALKEAAFRALHRAERGGSAGAHLRALRLARAEELLAATGATLPEIARAVGYGHAETLIAAFRRARGVTPGEFRRRANPFA